MPHIVEDRILEATTTTGTGAITLAGALTGFRRFSAVCAVADTVPYFIEAIDSVGLPTGDYEYGIGTYSGVNTLTRTTVQGSSNAGAAVNFAAGSKNVGIAFLKSQLKYMNRAYAEYTANADITAIIPADDSIPQIGEGTQILSLSFTPKSTTNRVRLRFHCEGALSVTGGFVAAIFSSASADALRANLTSVNNANASQELTVEHEYVPGIASALTFSVRVGPTTAGTLRLNGNVSGRLLGGVLAATLVVEEITP